MLPDATQRPVTFSAILPTKSQLLVMSLPLYSNLNLRVGSSQVAHVPHVTGQEAATPSSAHRLIVSLLATQLQLLEILLPSLIIFNRKAESAHAMVGSIVGLFDGEVVGPTEAAEGLGDGLIETDGAADGPALGVELGSRLG